MKNFNEEDDIFPESQKLTEKLALRGKHLNKVSKNFAEQLKATFSSVSKVTLDDIYFGSSPSSSIIQHPIRLPQFDSSSSQGQGPRKEFLAISPVENCKFHCTLILTEKVDEVQQIWRKEIFHRNWGFGLTLTPIPKSIQLEFNGYSDFKKTVEEFIQKYFGESGALQLDSRDSNRCPEGSDNTPSETCSKNDSEDIFDQEFHNIVLIPQWPFSKNNSNYVEFPCQVEFMTRDGDKLKTRFNFSLKYHDHPQKFRLKFIFQKISDGSEISVYSQFLVHTIIPSTISSNVASIQIYDRIQVITMDASSDNSNRRYSSQSSREFTRNFMNPEQVDRYWGTGKRIRDNFIHKDILVHEGYKVGFHYLYEIKPRPNREMQVIKHEERIQERRKLRAEIKTDLDDYYNSILT